MLVFRYRIGEKILRLRRGNFADRKLLPRLEKGPFGCWLASTRYYQIGWELARWTE